MIVGIGVDIVENSRINNAFATYKLKFIKKILTKEELKEINNKSITVQHLSGVFAAKEAVIKSLSTYLGFSLNFQDIIIKKNIIKSPVIEIRNKDAKKKLSKINLAITISHEKHISIAFVIAQIIK